MTPIGAPDSKPRSRSNNVIKYILDPVLRSKFVVYRADKISRSGSITHQIFKLIHECDLVISDLTGLNANVLYETGIRHAINKPTILMIDDPKSIPFDISHERTIIFDINDLASVSEAKTILKRMTKELFEAGEPYRSPFNFATGYAHSEIESTSDQLERIEEAVNDLKIDFEFKDFEVDVSAVQTSVDDMAWEMKHLKYDIQDIKKKLGI